MQRSILRSQRTAVSAGRHLQCGHWPLRRKRQSGDGALRDTLGLSLAGSRATPRVERTASEYRTARSIGWDFTWIRLPFCDCATTLAESQNPHRVDLLRCLKGSGNNISAIARQIPHPNSLAPRYRQRCGI